MAVTMELPGKLVVKSALHLQTEGSVTLGERSKRPG